MLKKEDLTSNEVLKELSEEQLNVIVSMSSIDENKVVGAIHQATQEAVETALVMKKPDGVNTVDWLKGGVTEKVKTMNTATEALTAAQNKVKELEDKIASGEGNEVLTQKLADAEALVLQQKKKIEDSEAEFNKQREKDSGVLIDLYANQDVSTGFSSEDIKFKPTDIINQNVRKTILDTAKQAVLSKNKASVEEVDGVKVLVLRDAEGNILRDSSMKPKTLSSLMLESDSVKGILDSTNTQGGGGSPPDGGNGGGGNGSFSLTGVTTQTEANDKIREHLTGLGKFPDQDDYIKMQNDIYKENKVSELPIK